MLAGWEHLFLAGWLKGNMATKKKNALKSYVVIVDCVLEDGDTRTYVDILSSSDDRAEDDAKLAAKACCSIDSLTNVCMFERGPEVDLSIEDWKREYRKDAERTEIEDKIAAMEADIMELKTKLGALS